MPESEKKMARKKKPYLENITVEATAAEGNGLAHVDGKVVFIKQGIPGDVVDVQINKVRSGYSQGFIARMKSPSPHRLSPFCAHFGDCGGCTWQTLPYPMQIAFKQQQVVDQLTRIGHLELPEVSPILGSEKTDHYRNKLEYTFSNRRWLHQRPELGFQLDGTVAFVKEKLRALGYEPADCGDHGVTATVGGRKGGKCVLIRADMDALPMKEESGLPFAADCEGAAHTCGHDTHTAMLLGAARLLKEMEDELPGTVKLMFQPAEELCAGAKSMLEDGVLENPHVDASFGEHIMAMLPCGEGHYSRGTMFASCDLFTITIKGHGGHGSQPQNSIDPIAIGAHLVTALQTINAREIAPDAIAVLTIGCFQAMEAIKYILGAGELLTGQLLTYDALEMEFHKIKLPPRGKGCAVCSDTPTITTLIDYEQPACEWKRA